MVFRGIAARRSTTARRVLPLVMGACLIAGCAEEPRPRSYLEFMEDSIAREGTLARCNQDREATAHDPECINARRAASTVAARSEAARAEQLEAASNVKREALRARVAAQQAAARLAEEEAQRAEEAAYDAQWSDDGAPPVASPEPGATASVPLPVTETSHPPYDRSGGAPSVERAPSQVPVSRADQLSYIELPPIESPVSRVLSEIELPPIATHRELEPEPEPEQKLEELTIPRPFRYAEPQ